MKSSAYPRMGSSLPRTTTVHDNDCDDVNQNERGLDLYDELPLGSVSHWSVDAVTVGVTGNATCSIRFGFELVLILFNSSHFTCWSFKEDTVSYHSTTCGECRV